MRRVVFLKISRLIQTVPTLLRIWLEKSPTQHIFILGFLLGCIFPKLDLFLHPRLFPAEFLILHPFAMQRNVAIITCYLSNSWRPIMT